MSNEAEKEWAKDNISDEFVSGVHPKFRLTKKTDDPVTTRINAGGDLINEQYLIYKGELPVVKLILENCLAVVNAKIEYESAKKNGRGKGLNNNGKGLIINPRDV